MLKILIILSYFTNAKTSLFFKLQKISSNSYLRVLTEINLKLCTLNFQVRNITFENNITALTQTKKNKKYSFALASFVVD